MTNEIENVNDDDDKSFEESNTSDDDIAFEGAIEM